MGKKGKADSTIAFHKYAERFEALVSERYGNKETRTKIMQRFNKKAEAAGNDPFFLDEPEKLLAEIELERTRAPSDDSSAQFTMRF